MRVAVPGAGRYVPDTGNLNELRAAVQECRGCELYRDATQAVVSAGSAGASTMLVGEQPGDSEDRQGVPFVGPAGRLLDRALAQAGIDPATSYVTNAVKHFKHHLRGQRRIHDKPTLTEIRACWPWLEAELALVRPKVVVALGATAAQAIAGSGFRVTRERGVLLDWPGDFPGPRPPRFLATIHPSAVLRAEEDRDEIYLGLVEDLATAAAAL